MVVAGAFLMPVPPSWPVAGVLLAVGWSAQGGEHAADLVRRGREGFGVVGEGGAGDGEHSSTLHLVPATFTSTASGTGRGVWHR
jgi:hypothetical protein